MVFDMPNKATHLSVCLSIVFLALNSKKACEMAQDVVCCSDKLPELLVSIDFDIHISQTTHNFKAKEQVQGTYYANATAAVFHLISNTKNSRTRRRISRL